MRQEKMSLSARRELTRITRQRYCSANRAEKARILDEFVEICAYHRKYAISVLSKPISVSSKSCKGNVEMPKVKRQHEYDASVGRALLHLWKVSGFLCSKRLVPFLPDLIEALERHGEMDQSKVSSEVRGKFLRVSAAT